MKSFLHDIFCGILQWFARLNDRIFRGNADFSGWVSQENAGLSQDHGNQYQPSTDALVRILKRYPISQEDRILDIGCGKGKAMYLMSRYPFGAVRGYDLSEALTRTANDNFHRLGIEDRCQAFQADALEFQDYDEYNYFYLFNPFPEEVFRVMIGHLMDSLKRKPRSCTMIYLHPVCHEYIIQNTPFKLTWKKKSWIDWFDYYCYSYTVPENQ